MRNLLPGVVETAVLRRLLQQAHQGFSVALKQPGRFIRVADPALRESIAALVEARELRHGTGAG